LVELSSDADHRIQLDQRERNRGIVEINPAFLFPTLFVFAFVIPGCGQVRSRSEVDSLLKAAIAALDHYQQIAPGIHCEEATQAEFRHACKIALEGLEERVQESKAEIARYRRGSSPRVVDL
jgi:hypothetical protein